MKIEIIPYEPKHIEWIMDHYPRSRELYWCRASDWDKWPNQWYEMGPAYTLSIDGMIIMCAGVMLIRDGLGESWMVLSELFYKFKKECFRAVRDKLDEIIEKYKLKRVHAPILTDFPEAERWMIHLGFTNETPNGMENFGPMSERMFLYGRKCP